MEAVAHHKELLPRLREAVAAQAGIEVPQLAEAKRISWTNLLFAAGSLLGIWLIIGVLSGAGGSLAAIKGASWGWVAMAFVFAQLSVVAEAWALLGAVVGQLPFGRCVALEVSNVFTSLVGGDVAVFAIRVRFFQRQGYDAAAAAAMRRRCGSSSRSSSRPGSRLRWWPCCLGYAAWSPARSGRTW